MFRFVRYICCMNIISSSGRKGVASQINFISDLIVSMYKDAVPSTDLHISTGNSFVSMKLWTCTKMNKSTNTQKVPS